MVRVGDLHILEPPLQELRGVAAHHDAVVADRRGHTRKRGDQARRIVHAPGIARRLLDAQHPAPGKGQVVQRLGLVDRGPHDNLVHGDKALLQADLEDHLLRGADEDLLQKGRFVAQAAHFEIVPSDGDFRKEEAPQRIGRRAGARTGAGSGKNHGGVRYGSAAAPLDNNAPDVLRSGLGRQRKKKQGICKEQEQGVLHGKGFGCGLLSQS